MIRTTPLEHVSVERTQRICGLSFTIKRHSNSNTDSNADALFTMPPDDSQPIDDTDKTTQSLLKSILKSVILIGIGALAGYGLFYFIFLHRCAAVLDDIERGNNQTISSLNELYLKALNDHKRCLEGDNHEQETYELRGRLEAQSDLIASHRSLLEKHKVNTAQLEETKAELESKEAELFGIQKRIDVHNQEKEELENDLKELKQTMVVELGEKTKTIESLQSSIQAFQMTEREMLQHVQSRHSVMSRQL